MIDKNTEERLYIFVHVPKTGGKTIVKHIEKNFTQEEIIRVNEVGDKGFTSIDYAKDYFKQLPDSVKNKVRIVYGHDIFYGIHEYFPDRDCRYITFIRHPNHRLLSHYNYCYGLTHYSKEEKPLNNRFWTELYDKNGQLIPFNEWFYYHKKYQNFVLKFLKKRLFFHSENLNERSIRNFDEILDKFYFVGITERSAQDFLFFYHLLGITKFYPDQNISVKKAQLETNTIVAIYQQNLLDTLFYYSSVYRNLTFKKNNSDLFLFSIKKITRKRILSLFLLKIKTILLANYFINTIHSKRKSALLSKN